jgi:xanthine dehydrogenase iron-sulfur cluster and FAD-binding subunit A
MWQEYISATNTDEVLHILAEYGERARVMAGGTDLILEVERGVRKGIDVVVDVTRIPGLDRITIEDETIHIGPLVTHNHCVASKLIVDKAFPLAQAAWEVGAPQIRNRGTIAGNLITASPANDTITPLMALGARLTLLSKRGERVVPLDQFYLGVRRTVMQPDEMLVDIAIPAMSSNQRGMFIKLGLRQAQAISLVNAAVVISVDSSKSQGSNDVLWVQSAAITLGAVAPKIIHAEEAETFLAGQCLDKPVIDRASKLAMQAAHPIDDVRSSGAYRHEMVRVCVARCLRAIAAREERSHYPSEPPLLWGKGYQGEAPILTQASDHRKETMKAAPIETRINGKEYRFTHGHQKTLLRLLREEAGLIGTKEGCAEGECGACTVFLDGVAVMSCLVPAPRAHHAEIVTIEGLAHDGLLHPVQKAFIEAGAVQCGYCTPGFLMSAAKLLEERPRPTKEAIQQAITGNLCRCTGYYKIVEAIEKASLTEVPSG